MVENVTVQQNVRILKCTEDTFEFRRFQLQIEVLCSKHAYSTDVASRSFSLESDFRFFQK